MSENKLENCCIWLVIYLKRTNIPQTVFKLLQFIIVQQSQNILVEEPTSPYLVILTLRLLMSYIYGAPNLDVSRSHTTTQHRR